ncbi:hypothetical protein OUZ56_012232 [Daphnia magna]|uniref:Uncharacterized protein n=1 Tax=Daphnia magna TaxID=35525 RepID=A0ABQ9Z2J9_9CRUS|nr:hypothetical protein OUZ56_012232 [Daphnia magna]
MVFPEDEFTFNTMKSPNVEQLHFNCNHDPQVLLSRDSIYDRGKEWTHSPMMTAGSTMSLDAIEEAGKIMAAIAYVCNIISILLYAYYCMTMKCFNDLRHATF